MGASSAMASSKAEEAAAKLGDATSTIASLQEELRAAREQVCMPGFKGFILGFYLIG